MSNNNIKPEKITKPIQLLAVWLLGLILLVSALITASGAVKQPMWLPGFFAISAVAIIPIFLILIFLLQTKFRPQMQEDEYYSKYLDNNTMQIIKKPDQQEIELLTKKIDEKFIELTSITKDEILLLKDSLDKISSDKNQLIKVTQHVDKFDSFISNTKNHIAFNTCLPNSIEILKILKIDINEFFGKDIPKTFLLTFGEYVDIGILKNLINDLTFYDLRYLRIIEEMTKQNHVYIGSYNYGEFDDVNEKTYMARVTDELLLKINNCQSSNELYKLIVSNMNCRLSSK